MIYYKTVHICDVTMARWIIWWQNLSMELQKYEENKRAMVTKDQPRQLPPPGAIPVSTVLPPSVLLLLHESH